MFSWTQVRRTTHRRGISYILSVVIMTLVISTMATSVLVWGLAQITETRTALSSAVQARIERLQQSLVVEDAQMINSTTLKVYIRNTGAVQIVVDQLYVNHTAATALSPARLSLSVKSIGVLYAKFSASDLPSGFSSGATVLVRVSTTRGVSDVGTWKL